MRLMRVLEIVGGVGVIGGTAYYTYFAGWKGFVFSVLSAIFGAMVVEYFGHSLPIIGYLLERDEDDR